MQSYGAMTLPQAQKKQREHSFLQLLLLLLNLLSCHFINERKTNEKKEKKWGGAGETDADSEKDNNIAIQRETDAESYLVNRQTQTERKTTISQYRERPRLRVT